MNIITDYLASLSVLQKAAEQNLADSNVQIPPVVLPVISVPRAVNINGGTAPRAAQESFLWTNTFSRTNQAAGETNEVSLGPGTWDLLIIVNGFYDFALARTEKFTIDLMDGFASRDQLWSLRGIGAAATFSDQIIARVSIKDLPGRDQLFVFGNETSIIFHVPAAGAAQTTAIDFHVLANRIF